MRISITIEESGLSHNNNAISPHWRPMLYHIGRVPRSAAVVIGKVYAYMTLHSIAMED